MNGKQSTNRNNTEAAKGGFFFGLYYRFAPWDYNYRQYQLEISKISSKFTSLKKSTSKALKFFFIICVWEPSYVNRTVLFICLIFDTAAAILQNKNT